MDKTAERLRPEPDREPKTQYAALPWRRTPAGVEVLLITSRETKRWVIPKGWPIKKLKPPASAAQEAMEEAGVAGPTSRKAIGVYHYDKRLRSGRTQHVRVLVFALEVAELKDAWPEQHQRERRWATPAEAAGLVDEKELKKLLAGFAP
ncbi:NUDIX hydrolase [Phenylobacterium sp. VNQ135]|uniref:NUDIX hydrolase n=1 Tax=Phenylobacterium sp. VNQ135 TaxID=3400922 RepID=UPI003C06871D